MAKKPTAAKTAAVAPAPVADETPVTETPVTETPSDSEPEIPTGEATETPADEVPADPAPAPAAPEAKVSLAKMRGPRGVPETAKIKLLVEANPKRPGSKAHRVFSQYVDGMTVGAFCDAVDASTNDDGSPNKGAGTPNLVYDSAHGFISIEGYTVPGGVIVAKPKAPAAPKAPKVAKAAAPAKHEGGEAQAADPEAASTAAAEVEAATAEEEV